MKKIVAWALAGVVASVLLAGGLVFGLPSEQKDRQVVHQLHAILRPDATGRWYIQNDATHAPHGVSLRVAQDERSLRIYMDMYDKAGTIQISSDDGFGGYIAGHANLGLNTAVIEVRAGGVLIDPADVWSYLPPDRVENGNGNFWINIAMMDE